MLPLPSAGLGNDDTNLFLVATPCCVGDSTETLNTEGSSLRWAPKLARVTPGSRISDPTRCAHVDGSFSNLLMNPFLIAVISKTQKQITTRYKVFVVSSGSRNNTTLPVLRVPSGYGIGAGNLREGGLYLIAHVQSLMHAASFF